MQFACVNSTVMTLRQYDLNQNGYGRRLQGSKGFGFPLSPAIPISFPRQSNCRVPLFPGRPVTVPPDRPQEAPGVSRPPPIPFPPAAFTQKAASGSGKGEIGKVNLQNEIGGGLSENPL